MGFSPLHWSIRVIEVCIPPDEDALASEACGINIFNVPTACLYIYAKKLLWCWDKEPCLHNSNERILCLPNVREGFKNPSHLTVNFSATNCPLRGVPSCHGHMGIKSQSNKVMEPWKRNTVQLLVSKNVKGIRWYKKHFFSSSCEASDFWWRLRTDFYTHPVSIPKTSKFFPCLP